MPNVQTRAKQQRERPGVRETGERVAPTSLYVCVCRGGGAISVRIDTLGEGNKREHEGDVKVKTESIVRIDRIVWVRSVAEARASIDSR